MAIQTMDDLIKALSERPVRPIYKASGTTKGAGTIYSAWRLAGFPTVANVPPTLSGECPNSTTIGALDIINAPVGKELFLAKLGIQSSATGTWMVYDRLWHNSGLVGNVATLQSFTQTPLTRHVDGIGVEAFIEIYTATGTTGVTATIKYTNTDNVSNRTGTASLTASPVTGQMFPFILQDGDAGVKSIQSVQLSATTGTAGNFGLVLLKRKAEMPITSANIGTVLDAVSLGLPPIENNACLSFMLQCTGTASGVIMGTAVIIAG